MPIVFTCITIPGRLKYAFSQDIIGTNVDITISPTLNLGCGKLSGMFELCVPEDKDFFTHQNFITSFMLTAMSAGNCYCFFFDKDSNPIINAFPSVSDIVYYDNITFVIFL